MTETAERVAAALGGRVASARVASGGYSTAERLVIELEDGRSVFAKCAHQDVIAEFLHDEYAFYSALQADFMPRLVAFFAEPPPVLVLEDLSAAYWPPLWLDSCVEAVQATLERVHARPPPAGLRSIEEERERLTRGWRQIARRARALPLARRLLA